MNNERLIETFLDLVKIDSPSKQEADVAAYCKAAFEAVGCSVVIDDTAKITGSNTGNLIATLEGTTGKTLMLSAHMDCVDPCIGVVPVITDGVIRSAGDTILGSDDKVGIAAALETVRTLAESGEPHATVRVVLTVQEEVGLFGAKSLDAGYLDCDLCLVLDGDGPVGQSIIGAPFHHTFTATFTGVASHAGVAPEKGISAIKMAAEAIGNMTLGRIDEHTVANVGTITGGTADNVVPKTCTITGECRSLLQEGAQSAHDALNKAMREAAGATGGSVEVQWVVEYAGFFYEDTNPLVQIVKEASSTLGLATSTATSGGGSDANVLAGKGVPALVLSTGMSDVHAVTEHLAVSDLEDLGRLLIQIATTLK